jgi:hypothetical protein
VVKRKAGDEEDVDPAVLLAEALAKKEAEDELDALIARVRAENEDDEVDLDALIAAVRAENEQRLRDLAAYLAGAADSVLSIVIGDAPDANSLPQVLVDNADEVAIELDRALSCEIAEEHPAATITVLRARRRLVEAMRTRASDVESLWGADSEQIAAMLRAAAEKIASTSDL